MDYFAANDLAAFSVISGGSTEITSVGRFDATYTNHAIQVTTGSIQSAHFINPDTGANASPTDFWVHLDYWTGNQSGTFAVLSVLNSAGTPVIRLANVTNGQIRVDYWNGAAWVAGTPIFTGVSILATIDIHVVCGAAGSIDFYVGNTLVGSVSGLNVAVTNGAYLALSGNTNNLHYSQLLVSDTNTIGAKVGDLRPNANGANTAWVNDYLNLVKNGYNDATVVNSSTLNDKESYGATDVTLPSAAHYVSSVFFSIRGRLNASSPANVKPLVRIGGVDYNGGYNFGNLNNVSFAPSLAAFSVDPSTGLGWVGVTNVNAAELGFITQA